MKSSPEKSYYNKNNLEKVPEFEKTAERASLVQRIARKAYQLWPHSPEIADRIENELKTQGSIDSNFFSKLVLSNQFGNEMVRMGY